MMLSAIFEPAKTASIPNVTPSERLVDANIISTATWSIIFTTGMAIGGFATKWIGVEAVFVLDALSYLVSAWFIYKAVIPQEERPSSNTKTQNKSSFWEDIRQNIGK